MDLENDRAHLREHSRTTGAWRQSALLDSPDFFSGKSSERRWKFSPKSLAINRFRSQRMRTYLGLPKEVQIYACEHHLSRIAREVSHSAFFWWALAFFDVKDLHTRTNPCHWASLQRPITRTTTDGTVMHDAQDSYQEQCTPRVRQGDMHARQEERAHILVWCPTLIAHPIPRSLASWLTGLTQHRRVLNSLLSHGATEKTRRCIKKPAPFKATFEAVSVCPL